MLSDFEASICILKFPMKLLCKKDYMQCNKGKQTATYKKQYKVKK